MFFVLQNACNQGYHIWPELQNSCVGGSRIWFTCWPLAERPQTLPSSLWVDEICQLGSGSLHSGAHNPCLLYSAVISCYRCLLLSTTASWLFPVPGTVSGQTGSSGSVNSWSQASRVTHISTPDSFWKWHRSASLWVINGDKNGISTTYTSARYHCPAIACDRICGQEGCGFVLRLPAELSLPYLLKVASGSTPPAMRACFPMPGLAYLVRFRSA